ncbi:hypothetical protein Bbelb_107870 [Branchiostoma belcheri]|nr:hypothetical protein Bbelb_107870 [Branchiostoma belcheri]
MQVSRLQAVFILVILVGGAVYHVQDSVLLRMYPVMSDLSSMLQPKAQLAHQRGLGGILTIATSAALEPESGEILHGSEVIESVSRDDLSSTDNATCSPHLNVAFLKVHKCGSSLVSHLVLRFAHEHGLLAALPRKKGDAIIGSLGKIRDSAYLHPPSGKRLNIFAHHAMYNRDRFHQIMNPDTRYITILREPLKRLQSAFLYFNLGKRFSGLKEKTRKGTALFTTYLTNPAYWDPKYKVPLSPKHREHYCFRNCMARDLGLKESDYENSTAVEEFVEGIENDFSTVMILEQLPASLVLLKRRMCWTLYNILYTMGVHTRRQRYKRDVPITREMEHAFYQHNNADVMLYKRFNESFHQQVSQEGDDFFGEVKHFVHVNHAVSRYCKMKKRDKQGKMTVKPSRWNEAFSVGQELCGVYGKKRQFFDKLLRRAYSRK